MVGKNVHALHRHRAVGPGGKLGCPVQRAAGGAVDHRRDVGDVRAAVAQQQNGLAAPPAVELPARLVRVLGVLLFVEEQGVPAADGKEAVQLPPAARRSDPVICRDVRNKLPRLFLQAVQRSVHIGGALRDTAQIEHHGKAAVLLCLLPQLRHGHSVLPGDAVRGGRAGADGVAVHRPAARKPQCQRQRGGKQLHGHALHVTPTGRPMSGCGCRSSGTAPTETTARCPCGAA